MLNPTMQPHALTLPYLYSQKAPSSKRKNILAMGGSSRAHNPPQRQKKDSFWEKGVSRRMSDLELRAENHTVYGIKKNSKIFSQNA
ncbi:MAG: hypothetical protein ACBR14_27820 [Microcoleus sp.]